MIKNRLAAATASLKKGGDLMPGEYTSYGYLVEIDGQSMEIATESELYELLEDSDD